MRGIRKRGRLVLAVAGATAALAALTLGTTSSSAAPKAGGGNITVWLSGTYAGATPGTTYRKWLDGVKARYEKLYPGSKVTYKLTPINNDQFTAQIVSAFASKAVPDAMLIYSGGYTTPYMKSSLLQLNSLVDKTPGFYKSQSAWDLSCLNLNCQNGKGPIYAVPNDAGTYALFYNKALFKKAGVAKPPTTYKELLADCAKFKAANILPLAYGDRDGYSTDNWVTYNYVSFMNKGDIAKVNDGSMKYTDPKLVKPLQDLVAFKKQGCVNPDASTHENNDANTYFTSGKAAMVQMFPFVVGAFEKALGKNLGLAPLPHVRERAPQGPGGRQLVPQLGDPEEREQPDRRLGLHQARDGQDRRRGARVDRRRTSDEHRGREDDQGSVRAVLRQARVEDRPAAARQRRPGEGRAALLQAAPGRVRGQGHGTASHAERAERARDAEPLEIIVG